MKSLAVLTTRRRFKALELGVWRLTSSTLPSTNQLLSTKKIQSRSKTLQSWKMLTFSSNLTNWSCNNSLTMTLPWNTSMERRSKTKNFLTSSIQSEPITLRTTNFWLTSGRSLRAMKSSWGNSSKRKLSRLKFHRLLQVLAFTKSVGSSTSRRSSSSLRRSALSKGQSLRADRDNF